MKNEQKKRNEEDEEYKTQSSVVGSLSAQDAAIQVRYGNHEGLSESDDVKHAAGYNEASRRKN